MSTHNDPKKENEGDPTLLPAFTKKKKISKDIFNADMEADMERALGEGFNPPAQKVSLEDARRRENGQKNK
jgi:hypothetical protein